MASTVPGPARDFARAVTQAVDTAVFPTAGFD